MAKSKFVYIVFRINQKYFKTIAYDLKRFGFHKVKAYIPTVQVLVKTSKGKDIYEEIPMLFVYGFLKIPTELAFNRYFLEDLRRSIPGITSFLKTVQYLHNKKLKARIDNADIFDDFTIANTIPRKEIRRLMNLAKNNEVFNLDDITRVCIGDYLVLRGYPYEGMEAIILDVYPDTKKVQVQLVAGCTHIITTVNFQNIVYSIYTNFNEDKLLSSPSLILEKPSGSED